MMLRQNKKIIFNIFIYTGFLSLVSIFVISIFFLNNPWDFLISKLLWEQPVTPSINIDLPTGGDDGNDYWVWIRTYDRYSMDKASSRGRSKKGDIVFMAPANSQFIPTDTERENYAVIKVNGLTQDDVHKYTQSWTEEEEKASQDDPDQPFYPKTLAYRKYALDIDRLGIKVGFDPNPKSAFGFRQFAYEKTSETLAQYERGQKLYALKRYPKYLASKIKDFIIPPSSATATEVSCINGTGDSNCTGETFDSLTLWEDATDYDLTASDTPSIEAAYCYDDDGNLDDNFTIDGATTDATYYRIVTVPAGERHNGTVDGGGFKLVPNTTIGGNNVIGVEDNFTRVEWMQITGWRPIKYGNGRCIGLGNSTRCVVNNNFCYTPVYLNSTGYAGIGDYQFQANNDFGSLIYNNIIYNLKDDTAHCYVIYSAGTWYNNTAYGCSNWGFKLDNYTAVLKNNLALDNGENYGWVEDYALDGGDYNSQSDNNGASASTTGNAGSTKDMVDLVDDDIFVDLASGTEDFHLKSTALVIDGGSDESATFTIDIDSDSRPYPVSGDWDIGADEEDTASSAPETLDISGTIYQTNGSDALTGSAKTVNTRVYTAGVLHTTGTAESNSDDGTYTISLADGDVDSGDIIVVYLDNEDEDANVYTVTDGSTDITGLNLIDDELIIRNDKSDTTAITNTILNYFDNNDDADMLYTVTSGALTMENGNELNIATGGYFTPGGTVNTGTDPTGQESVDLNGTWTEGSETTTVNGDFDSTGGTFTKGTGTVKFAYNNSYTTTVTGTLSFNNLTFDNSTTGTMTYTISNTLTVAGTLTISGNKGVGLSTGTINAQGDISITSTNTGSNGGTATININGGSSQVLTGSGNAGQACLPSVTINKPGDSGNLTLASVICVSGNWTMTSIGNGSIITTGSTVTFVYNNNYAATIAGTQSFNNLGFDNSITSTMTYTISDTLTVTGTLTISDSNNKDVVLNTGTINAQGDITITNTGTSGGGTATININGSGTQTLDGPNTAAYGKLPNVTVNSTGTLILKDIFSVAGDWTYTQGTINNTSNDSTAVFYGTHNLDGQGTVATMAFDKVEFAGDTTLTGNLDVNDNLTIDASSSLDATGYAVNVAGNWSNSGTFTGTDTDVTFDGATAQTIDSAETWDNLTISNTYASPDDDNDVDPSAIQTITGLLNITDGQWQSMTGDDYTSVTIGSNGIIKPDSGASITVSGDWSNSGTFTRNASTVTFDGIDTQTITGANTWTYLTIANTYASPNDDHDVDPGAIQTVTGTLTVSDGQYSPYTGDDYHIVSIGANGILKPDSGANITISGDWSNSGTFTHNNANFTFDGTSTQTIDSANTWDNLTVANTYASPDDTYDVDPGAIQTVTGLLNITDGQWSSYNNDNYASITIGSDGTLKPDSSATITVSEDWTNNGTFTHNNSTITLNGSSQALTGSNTFYTLIKSVSSTDTLTFDNTVTQTITNTLTLNGAASNLLSLRSDSDANQFGLALEAGGTQTLAYLDIKDSDATGGDELDGTDNCTDSGNNLNWDFGATEEEGNNNNTGSMSSGAGNPTVIYPEPGPNPIVIGDGSTYTNSPYTMIYLDCRNCPEMNLLLNNDNDFPGDNWTNYVSERPWHIENTGSNQAKVKFRRDDKLTNPFTAFITYDPIPPEDIKIDYPRANQEITSQFPVFKGSAEPNSKVSLKIGQRVYRFEVPPSGNWSVPITPALPVGSYLLEARAEDWAGNTSGTVKVPFSIISQVIQPKPETPGQGEIVVPGEEGEEQPGQTEGTETPQEEEKEYIEIIPELLSNDFWYQAPQIPEEELINARGETLKKIALKFNDLFTGISKGVNTVNDFNRNVKQKMLTALRKSGQALALSAKKTNQGLISATEKSGQAVQSGSKTLAGNIKYQSQRLIINPLTNIYLSKDLTLNKLAKVTVKVVSPIEKIKNASTQIRLALANALDSALKATRKQTIFASQTLGRGIAYVFKGIHQGLMSATNTTGQLARNGRLAIANNIKNLFIKKVTTPPATELAQAPETETPVEVPTLIPKNMPNDVVVVKSRKGNLNLARAGILKLAAGTKAYSFIRPSVEPEKIDKIVGRLLFNETLSQEAEDQLIANNSQWHFIKTAQAATIAMDWQVAEVEYQLLNENNIYMAELDVPQIAGEYTFQTEISLKEGSSKFYSLKAEINQKGYVYEEWSERNSKARIEGVTITLYVRNAKTNQYDLWPAEAYDQINPQITSDTGEYYYMVPIGEYKMVLEKKGYGTVEKNFVISQPGPITDKIEMKYGNSWFSKINPFD